MTTMIDMIAADCAAMLVRQHRYLIHSSIYHSHRFRAVQAWGHKRQAASVSTLSCLVIVAVKGTSPASSLLQEDANTSAQDAERDIHMAGTAIPCLIRTLQLRDCGRLA